MLRGRKANRALSSQVSTWLVSLTIISSSTAQQGDYNLQLIDSMKNNREGFDGSRCKEGTEMPETVSASCVGALDYSLNYVLYM